MHEKRENLRAIKTALQEIHRNIALICDGTATRSQRHAALEATNALHQFENFKVSKLRREFFGR